MESYWAPTSISDRTPHPRQVRFEARRVRDLLKVFGLDHLRDELIAWHEDSYRVPRLTFEAFHEACPTFPYLLDAQSFFNTFPEGNEWTRVGKWMTDFRRTFVAERYGRLLDRQLYFSDPAQVILRKPLPDYQRGLPVAMAFPWQGVKGGLVAHSGVPLTASGFFFDIVHADHELRLHVERYVPWLRAVARSGWTPDGPLAAEEEVVGELPRGPLMRPDLLRVCGRDARDTWLLSWLLWATAAHASVEAKSLLVRVKGRPHLSATHEQLSVMAGLSVQQVRDGLDALCSRKFVARTGGGAGRRTCLRVDRDAIVAAAKDVGK